jgi:hypothetical protein
MLSDCTDEEVQMARIAVRLLSSVRTRMGIGDQWNGKPGYGDALRRTIREAHVRSPAELS